MIWLFCLLADARFSLSIRHISFISLASKTRWQEINPAMNIKFLPSPAPWPVCPLVTPGSVRITGPTDTIKMQILDSTQRGNKTICCDDCQMIKIRPDYSLFTDHLFSDFFVTTFVTIFLAQEMSNTEKAKGGEESCHCHILCILFVCDLDDNRLAKSPLSVSWSSGRFSSSLFSSLNNSHINSKINAPSLQKSV